jgi:transcriptional regulator with XRE-family HTH domain
MPEPLWKIRQRKGMSVNQLAAKSGVPAISISEYESGQSIRSADLPKLAKALYVEEWDIEIKCSPPSRGGPAAAQPAARATTPQPKPARSPAARAAPSPLPARPSQIEHLLNLTTRHFAKDRTALENELDKPLESLSRREASQLLNQYQRLLAEARTTELPDGERAKRRRAYLPEGVDAFELDYLTNLQDSEALLQFSLFDGHGLEGTIKGFSPYSITIREKETGDEITLQKLAIAYYRITSGASAAKDNPGDILVGDEP